MQRARHHSLFAPRGFDNSPHLRIVKPPVERGFDRAALPWADIAFDHLAPEAVAPAPPPAG